MLSQTHWLISSTAAKIASEQMPGKINPWAFCWGSVLPDLVRPYSSIPHTINGSEHLLAGLLNQTSSIQVKGPWALSLHLGIISHFVSDYFCLAHNDPSLDALIPHTIYEARLHSSIDGGRLRNLALSALPNRGSEQFALRKYLRARHRDYRDEAPGPPTDAAYAMQAVLGLIWSLPEPAKRRRKLFKADAGLALSQTY